MGIRKLARDAALILTGSAALYVTSVACSDDPSAAPPDVDADAGRDADGLLDVVRDVLADVFDAAPDAVPDARAQAPVSVTAQCNVLVPNSTGADNYVYAEASFPGKTLEELAAASVISPLPTGGAANGPQGYTHQSLTPAFFLKPGGVAVWCGMGSIAGVRDRAVTFLVR